MNKGEVGYTDPQTGRVAITIEMWSNIDDPDLPVYWNIDDAFDGEEWAYIDGIDLHVAGLSADVWFESGRCKTVPVSTIVYMAKKHAAKLLGESA